MTASTTTTTAHNDNAPVTIGVPYEVKGLVVKIVAPPQSIGDDSASPFRRRFQATVFYLPPTPENRRFRAALAENTFLDIHSFIPAAEIEKAKHFPGTLTFDCLTVVFSATSHSYAIDKRAACLVPGTRAHVEHVQQAQHRVLGTGKPVKNPCERCDCGPNAQPW